MLKHIITAHGSSVWSDKEVGECWGRLVVFTDGSYVDVGKGGKSANKGEGSIEVRLATKNGPAYAIGPQKFPNTSKLEIRDIQQFVLEVVYHDGSYTELAVERPTDGTPDLDINLFNKDRDNVLVIDGNLNGDKDAGIQLGDKYHINIKNARGVVIGPSGSVTMNFCGGKYDIQVSPPASEETKPETRIIVKVPKGAHITFSNAKGRLIIDDKELPISVKGEASISG